MENSVKKSLFASFGFKLFLIVAFTIVSSGALTYGFLYAGKRQTGANTLTTTCFDVSFTEGKSIALTNARSMSDASGQRTEPYTFSVTNNCQSETAYTVILSVKSSSINSKFISTSLNGNSASILSEALANRHYEVGEGYNESYVLTTGSIKKDETAKFDLRIWINSIATYDDVKGLSWEGEVKVVSGIKEVEDMRILSNKLKKIAKDTNPDFTKASLESGIYSLEDNDGASYYYRGNTDSNHMYFAGMNFRIVRLNGDGSLRIAYDGELNGDSKIAVPDVAPLIEGYEDNLNRKLEEWYQNNIVANGYDKFVAVGSFCQDTKTNATTPTFTCSAPISKKVGLLSLDETVTAGAAESESNTIFYLNRNAKFWIGTQVDQENMYVVDASGNIVSDNITNPNGVVPVINISKDYIAMISGDGSIENPYTL